MRSVKLKLPFFGNKTSHVKLFKGESFLYFRNTFETTNEFLVVLVNHKGSIKHVSIVPERMETVQIEVAEFEWFWVEHGKFLGRGGEIMAVIKENQ